MLAAGLLCALTLAGNAADAATRRVPQDYRTIQAAITAARAGDTVLVSPGTYAGPIVISKAITLASLFFTTGDKTYVNKTTINGGAPIILIKGSTAAGTTIVGLRFTGGRKGVQAYARANVMNNSFESVGSDQMSFERTGGTIRNNRFYKPGDDGIDLDGALETLIEGNTIISPHDDGIEARNMMNTTAAINVVIRGNTIQGAQEDGIQLIDYAGTSGRKFRIERNLITGSIDAGIGIMDNADSNEDFRAAQMPEQVLVLDNTLSGNRYGMSGGGNAAVVNNIIANSATAGIKKIATKSTVAYNLFFHNGVDFMGTSNIDQATTTLADPLFTSDFHLQAGSPAIDKGTAEFVFGGQPVLVIPTTGYAGNAPDLGVYEYTAQ